MSTNGMAGTSPHNAFQNAALALSSLPSVDLPHVLVVVFFLFVLRAKTTYLPISVPAFLLAAYREWALLKKDGTSIFKYSLSSILACWFGTFAYRLVKHRIMMHHLPGLPHNILFGSFPTFAKEIPKLPFDCHIHVMMNHLADEYNLREKGLFYVDLYPMQYTPVLVIASPEVAAQVTQINSYPKTTALAEFAPVLGRRGLVSLEGTAWKDVRTMFNPGFSNANLLTMVPMMVEETQIFASRLSKIAAGDGFASSSETLTAELTIDIIGRALFGIKFNSQNATNPLVNSLIQASHLIPNGSDISPQRVNLWRELKLKYHEKIVNTQVMNMLRMRWSELASSPQTAAHSTAIFDIAMATYMKRGGKVEKNVTTNFLELMRDNVKTFIFGGHDTSSSVLAYSFYELSRHPEILEEVRAEHESVLGPDPNTAAQRLNEDPKLVNALLLTTAIIREILRLHLPAFSVRHGPPGGTVTGLDGKTYPTEGFMVLVVENIVMHDPKIFPKPYEFIPNRFLPDKSPFPPIPKNAFRPFEKGPRDCIGQELAMLEVRIALALILRKFDFQEAYEELDRRLGRTAEKPTEQYEKTGGRAYQILHTTAKPKDGLPLWVKER